MPRTVTASARTLTCVNQCLQTNYSHSTCFNWAFQFDSFFCSLIPFEHLRRLLWEALLEAQQQARGFTLWKSHADSSNHNAGPLEMTLKGYDCHNAKGCPFWKDVTLKLFIHHGDVSIINIAIFPNSYSSSLVFAQPNLSCRMSELTAAVMRPLIASLPARVLQVCQYAELIWFVVLSMVALFLRFLMYVVQCQLCAAAARNHTAQACFFEIPHIQQYNVDAIFCSLFYLITIFSINLFIIIILYLNCVEHF